MRFLFTGDTQLEASNLHQAKQMEFEIDKICIFNKVDALIHLGDLKNKYSPIDGKVLNFAIRNTSRNAKKRKYRVLLGNHDRYGMHTDTNSWLPVLRKAGAVTFDTPDFETFDDGSSIFYLPYRTSISQTKADADFLAERVKDPKKSILVFHQDLKGCGYNVLMKSESKLKVSDLHPEKYLYCIGGHIHLQHNVKGNVWYAGSPFAMDWGEVNQRKGYLLVDTKTGRLRRIYSDIPRLFDPGLPNFEESKPDDWTGATVRARVPIWKSEDYQSKLNEVRSRLEALCKGAHVLVLPKFDNSVPEDQVLDLDTSDFKKVKRYVDKTCPKELVGEKEKLVAYIVYRIKQDHIVFRQNKRIEFISGTGSNFLSYKKLSVDYRKPGIHLVTGRNRDWIKRSNGSGKTNYLQLPAVALFGCTFKGQKHDRWALSKNEEPSIVNLKFKTSDGRVCVIERGRRPGFLKLSVEGQDESRDNKRSADQAEIERLTGYTWETLGAAIYVDQETSNILLYGTDAERKKVLERAQNLEKWAKALKRVKDDFESTEEFEEEVKQKVEIVKNELLSVSKHLSHVNSTSADKRRLYGQLEAKKHAFKRLANRKKLVKQLAACSEGKKELSKEVTKLYTDLNLKIGELRETNTRLHRLQSLDHECPVCEQKVDKQHVSKLKRELLTKKYDLKNEAADIEKKHKDAEIKFRGVNDAEEFCEAKLAARDAEDSVLTRSIKSLEQTIATLESVDKHAKDLKHQLRELKQDVRNYQNALLSTKKEKVFLEYCMRVLSRNGLPAFLNSYLCPQLNREAEIQSELWSDGEIKIRFDVEEGAFVPRIINVHGGKNIPDQSTGEGKMASLITSFTFKEVLTPCNIMILDEPGEGLDAVNATWFAKKLKEVGPKLGTVFVTSHNANIISELEGVRQIKIQKKGGISSVIQSEG